MARVIILDACVLIAHLDSSDVNHERAVKVLHGLAGAPKGISVLTRAEIFVGPTRAGRLRAARDAVDALSVHTFELLAHAADALAELRASSGLRMPDCCVLLTAELNGPPEIATFDRQLSVAAARRGITVHAG